MWYPMFHGEVRLRNLAVAQNQDGRLEVFGTAPDDRIWHAWQSVAGKGWELCVRRQLELRGRDN